jgi:hypothetical protein
MPRDAAELAEAKVAGMFRQPDRKDLRAEAAATES